MMYAALAGVLIVGGFAVWAAWDFGRRWLVSYERAKEAALIREMGLRDEFTDALAKMSTQVRMEMDALRDSYGTDQSTTNLKVRELSDRLEHVQQSYVDVVTSVTRLDKRVTNTDGDLVEHRCMIDKLEKGYDGCIARHEALRNDLDRSNAWLTEGETRIGKLEQAPAAEPVDLTKYNKAVENLARQLHELSRVSATQQYVQDQLDASEKRLNGTLTGAIAKGARIRA